MTEPIEDPEPEPQPEPEPESAPTLFPELAQAVLLPLPELGYDRMMVWLSVEPWLSADRKVLDARANVVARPFRVLPDGVVDVAPEMMTRTLVIERVSEAAQMNQELGSVIRAIAAALAGYVNRPQ